MNILVNISIPLFFLLWCRLFVDLFLHSHRLYCGYGKRDIIVAQVWRENRERERGRERERDREREIV